MRRPHDKENGRTRIGLGRHGWDDDPILEIVGAQVFDKLIEALDFLLRRLLIARGLVRDASGAVHDIVFNVNGCV